MVGTTNVISKIILVREEDWNKFDWFEWLKSRFVGSKSFSIVLPQNEVCDVAVVSLSAMNISISTDWATCLFCYLKKLKLTIYWLISIIVMSGDNYHTFRPRWTAVFHQLALLCVLNGMITKIIDAIAYFRCWCCFVELFLPSTLMHLKDLYTMNSFYVSQCAKCFQVNVGFLTHCIKNSRRIDCTVYMHHMWPDTNQELLFLYIETEEKLIEKSTCSCLL